MALFDSHCHFDFAVFDVDRAEVWERCVSLGVKGLLIPGVSPEQWTVAAQLCEVFPGCCYGVGIHPYWIERQLWYHPEAVILSELEKDSIGQSLSHAIAMRGGDGFSACVALGECGLDQRLSVPMSLQQDLLEVHLTMANLHHKPIIIHSVKAHHHLLESLKRCPPRYGGVIHAFSGSLEVAHQFIERGFLLGVGGTITYERAAKTRHALSRVPLSQLLLETDAPDMPLYGQQGQRNSPEYLPHIAHHLAALRGVSVEEVITTTSDNASRLFAWRV